MPIHNHFYLIDNNKINPFILTKDGPILPCEIFIPSALLEYLTETNKPIPQPIIGNALIDTGASISAVDKKILEQLAIPPHRNY